MNPEAMDLEELARYLQRDVREVTRLASRGYLPGRKVGGEWRFSRAEITHWLETQMHAYTEEELTRLEGRPAGEEGQLLVSTLLPERCMAVPMQARTKASVLKELVSLAERSWQVYDPAAILEALKQREEMASTALESGLAIPHPHRPLPNAVAESILAFGRTSTGIPFGAPQGILTDVFFLVCCRDAGTHVKVLARISRLFLRVAFADELRAAETPAQTHQLIEAAERELLGL
jgi:PTS system nitrogen regulatory IIA component